MSVISRLYDFVAGTRIKSAEVDNEFNQLVAAHNTNDTTLSGHIADVANPHVVTKTQLGLGNVTNNEQATQVSFLAHLANTLNPHSVTKSQVGLSNVDNTADDNKPVSSATQTALSAKVSTTRKINNKALSQNITLDGSDILLTGMEAPVSYTAIEKTDTINEAFGKVKKFFSNLAASISIDGPATFGTRGTGTIGARSLANGEGSIASGLYSHAEGFNTTASGSASHSSGESTIASGTSSHAEGQGSDAVGYAAHAEGFNGVANGHFSHAEGYDSIAQGDNSHAEGYNATATGLNSHAEGHNALAAGVAAHAQNAVTIAQGFAQTAIGKYNIAQGTGVSAAESDQAFIIGNGTGQEDRSNALTVDWAGNVNIASSAKYKINGNPLCGADLALTDMTEAETYAALADTDTINTAFGKVKKFFTDIAATVRATVLTGLSTASSAAVTATDSMLVAIGKLQAQITERVATTRKVNTTALTGDINFYGWTNSAESAAGKAVTCQSPITLARGNVIAVSFTYGNTNDEIYLAVAGNSSYYVINLAGTGGLYVPPMGHMLFVFTGTSGGDVFYPVITNKAQVGLGSVDNTSDANKPISTAMATALGTLANLTTTEKASLVGAINELNSDKVETSAIINTLTETSTGKVLDARQGKALNDLISTILYTPQVVVSGNITLGLTDVSKKLMVTAASVITIPKNSVVAFPLNTEIVVISQTTGEVSIAPVDGDVTLQSFTTWRKLSGQYAAATLVKTATDTWVLIGGLKA